jgi:hypothetical protein
MFSVNGIDCLDHDGRMAALAEVARVCRPGALFFFSSHNLDAVEHALSPAARARALRTTRTGARVPLAIAKHMPSVLLTRAANAPPARLAARDWVWISKGWPPRAPCGTYHVKPMEVRRQLQAAGFTLERLILPSGAEASYEACRGRTKDLWLNYLARRSGA